MQDARLAALHVLSELDPGINLSKESKGMVGYMLAREPPWLFQQASTTFLRAAKKVVVLVCIRGVLFSGGVFTLKSFTSPPGDVNVDGTNSETH